jgi:hypothetical protein
MSAAGTIIVLGLGEVGRPVLDIASRHHRTVGIDITPPAEPIERVDVMHVCYPFEIKDFVGDAGQRDPGGQKIALPAFLVSFGRVAEGVSGWEEDD